MAKNIISTDGAFEVKYTAPTGGVTAGALKVVQRVAFIPLESATGGQVVDALVGGAVVLPKAAATSANQFAKAYYYTTGTTNKVAATGAANTCIGYFLEAATTGAAKLTAKVRLVAGPVYAA